VDPFLWGGSGKQVVEAPAVYEQQLTGAGSGLLTAEEGAQPSYTFNTEDDRKVAAMALDFIQRKYERKLSAGVHELKLGDIQAELVKDVEQALAPAQGTLDVLEKPNISKIVSVVASSVAENTIEIPEIVVIPSREVNFWFDDFDLTDLDSIRYQPLSDRILIQNLREQTRRELARSFTGPREERIENYIVKHLIDFDQVDYDTQSELLFKLADQVVAHLRSYLDDDEDVENVALTRGKDIARIVFDQMMQHYQETPADYKAKLVRSFRLLRPQAFSVTSVANVVDIDTSVKPLSSIRTYIFKGTTKSPYNFHKFDSDPERRFALMIDRHEAEVLKWLKPGPQQFGIEYRPGKNYEPDFVIETNTEKFIVEVKARNELADTEVQTKARAAKEWVTHANTIAQENGGKPWRYALVPDDTINGSATLNGLISRSEPLLAR